MAFEAPPPTKRMKVMSTSRYYCPHCASMVAKSTFFDHKQRFYDSESECWSRRPMMDESCDEDTQQADIPGSAATNAVDIDTGVETEDTSAQAPAFPVHSTCSSPHSVIEHEQQPSSPLHDITVDQSCLEDEDLQYFHNDCLDADLQETEDHFDTEIQDDDDDISDIPGPSRGIHPVVRLIMLFFLIWQFAFHVSDSGIVALLLFMHHLLRLLSRVTGANVLLEMAEKIPKTITTASKILGLHVDSFTRYVVCPTCHAVYDFDDCYTLTPDKKEKIPKTCRFIAYPDHPHQSRRQPCGTPLLKKVRRKGGKLDVKPFKEYCFQSLESSLKRLLGLPSFLEKCMHLETVSELAPDDMMCDVHDGKIWKEFYDTGQKNIKSGASIALLLTLNVDWFQPFKHSTYSVGAIYLAVQNLPRSERYKFENVLIVGIVPGPHEPPLTMNSYLQPLVLDLQRFWDGVVLESCKGKIRVRAALSCASCDIPATRKVCGFVGHTAKHGCSKCLREFKSTAFKDKLDYGGFNYDSWELRTNQDHRQWSTLFLEAKTKSGQDEVSQLSGVRYSALLELPYFDPVRMHVIDPMHNLLLGTAKHMVRVWLDLEIITSKQFDSIHQRISGIACPHSIGRLPSKIMSSFAGFTADQWKAWTLIYSAVALKGILPSQHLVCWLLYVKACRILCVRYIRRNDIDTAHTYLVQFCKKFEELYGSQMCTPNMHMHLHLRESLLDYGPVYGFWCFAFERYNGQLGSYHTNSQQVEVQMMRKCIREQSIRTLSFSSEHSDFSDILEHKLRPSSDNFMKSDSLTLCNMRALTTASISSRKFSNIEYVKLLSPIYQKVLPQPHAKWLKQLYAQLYPGDEIEHFSRFFLRSHHAMLGNEEFGSKGRNERKSVIKASWPKRRQEKLQDSMIARIGIVQYYLQHHVTFKNESKKFTHIFAYTNWKEPHDKRDYFGSSAVVTSPYDEAPGLDCFLPMVRIVSSCAHTELSIDFHLGLGNEKVFIAIPFNSNYVV